MRLNYRGKVFTSWNTAGNVFEKFIPFGFLLFQNGNIGWLIVFCTIIGIVGIWDIYACLHTTNNITI